MIQHLDSQILNECIEKSLEKINYAFLDWKGIKSSDKSHVLEILKDVNLGYEKI